MYTKIQVLSISTAQTAQTSIGSFSKGVLAAGRHGGRVVTRFPPEPNGYLHIGHAKSIYRTTRLRPILLEAETLRIRTGLRWTVLVPRAHVVALHKQPPKSEPFLRAALPGTTPLWIELAEPVTAQGPYGKLKQAR